jgi:hypothetical protein
MNYHPRSGAVHTLYRGHRKPLSNARNDCVMLAVTLLLYPARGASAIQLQRRLFIGNDPIALLPRHVTPFMVQLAGRLLLFLNTVVQDLLSLV